MRAANAAMDGDPHQSPDRPLFAEFTASFWAVESPHQIGWLPDAHNKALLPWSFMDNSDDDRGLINTQLMWLI